MNADPAARPAYRPSAAVTVLVGVLAFGCEAPTVNFTETKGVGERLTSDDMAAIVTVLRIAGEKERPHLPKPFLPAPQWADQRSLPVAELTAEERDRYETAWSPSAAAAKLPAGDPWETAVSARRLTREQFCALMISVAAALGRAAADSELDLENLKRRGAREIDRLSADERPFSSLPPDERHATLRRATWVAIAARASYLAQVPPGNVQLVDQHREKLAEVLPNEYFADPFGGFYPRPEDYGIPFEEGDVSDADLTWNPENALIGTDRPSDAPAL